MAKTFRVDTDEMVEEHENLIPKLKKVGLKKDAAEQTEELKEIKKKKLKTIINK